MNQAHLDIIRAVNVRAIISDVDGTLTDGHMHTTSDGRVFRSFYSQDGLGHSLVTKLGVHVAWLSATTEPESVRTRARMLRIADDHLDLAPGEKGDRFIALCAAIGCDPGRTIYIGDDENDLPPMRLAGCSACPADAHPAVRAEARIVLANAGGRGAFRELADLVRAVIATPEP